LLSTKYALFEMLSLPDKYLSKLIYPFQVQLSSEYCFEAEIYAQICLKLRHFYVKIVKLLRGKRILNIIEIKEEKLSCYGEKEF